MTHNGILKTSFPADLLYILDTVELLKVTFIVWYLQMRGNIDFSSSVVSDICIKIRQQESHSKRTNLLYNNLQQQNITWDISYKLDETLKINNTMFGEHQLKNVNCVDKSTL